MTSAQENGNAIDKMFITLRNYIEKESALKEEISGISRELQLCEREVIVILDKTHMASEDVMNEVFEKCHQIIKNEIKPLYEKLKNLVSPDVYYKFHGSFSSATQRITFAIAFIHFLKVGELISLEAVADLLELDIDGRTGFHLDLEDYLHGVLYLTSELSRFAVNAVAAGDNERPFQIAEFLRIIDSNFRLLNLKNDLLRKRFDGLKYEVQRCDQIIYDLTIRGLRSFEEHGRKRS